MVTELPLKESMIIMTTEYAYLKNHNNDCESTRHTIRNREFQNRLVFVLTKFRLISSIHNSTITKNQYDSWNPTYIWYSADVLPEEED